MTRAIHTILVPLDMTENAEAIVNWAIEWAEKRCARLLLLHVLPPVSTYIVPAFPGPMNYDEHYARARNAVRRRLLPLADRAEASGVETGIRVRVGHPAEEILALAHDLDAGLIVLGTHGRKGFAHVFLGSTAEKVVRLAECPVFVVKEPRPILREEKAEVDTAAVK